jgi:hypothetical protein
MPGSVQFVDQRAGGVGLDVDESHPGAIGGKGANHVGPDAAGAAGDKDDPIFKTGVNG